MFLGLLQGFGISPDGRDQEPVDDERDRVDAGVQHEGEAAEQIEEGTRRHSPDAESGNGGRFESGNGAATQALVAGRDDRDVAKDGGDARGSGDIPSSARVPPRIQRFVAAAVMRTATAPRRGPTCMTRCAPIRSERTPNTGERTSSVAK